MKGNEDDRSFTGVGAVTEVQGEVWPKGWPTEMPGFTET